MCDFKIKYRHPNPLQWHHWATAADKQWFRPVAASCPAVRVQSFRRTDRGINCVARVHFKSDTWEPCNLVRSNKQKHTFWRLPTKCQVDARQVHCLVYVQTTGDRKIITAHHYIAHHSFKANKEINSEAIKIDKCSGALSPTGSKVCYGNGFLCNLVLSADLLQSMWCVLRWKKAGDSLLFSICRDAGVHHGEAWLVWWKGVGESTCTAGGAHGYHMPLPIYTEKPNKPFCQLSSVVTSYVCRQAMFKSNYPKQA